MCDNYHRHSYVLCPWWSGQFLDAALRAKQTLMKLAGAVLGYWHRRCSEDLWEGGIRSRLCVLVPHSLRLQQCGTVTGFISTSCRSLHRLIISASPEKSLGTIDWPWLCFASWTNQPFWETVEGGRAQVSCWFLTVISSKQKD